jgi:hypothetical protein
VDLQAFGGETFGQAFAPFDNGDRVFQSGVEVEVV